MKHFNKKKRLSKLILDSSLTFPLTDGQYNRTNCGKKI